MKRFWTDATFVASEQDGRPGYAILLDGKPVRIPGGDTLHVRSSPLARAISDEWRSAGSAKGGEFEADDTPLTRLAGTAQVRIAPDPRPTVEALARYAETDLLCYRAAEPVALVERQAEAWQPWLDWAERTFDAPLAVTSGIVHVTQNPRSIHALRAALGSFDAAVLAGLGVLVPSLGSLVLGLAIVEGQLDAAQAHRLGALDELFQAELWGQDAEAARRLAAVAADIAVAARFIALARSEASA